MRHRSTVAAFLTLLALALLVAFGAPAQVVCTNFLKATNGGLACDTSTNSTRSEPYSGTSAPGTPYTKQFWIDTNFTPPKLKRYTGSAWQTIGGQITVQADFSSFPTGQTGDCVIATNTGRMACWNGTNWKDPATGLIVNADIVPTYSAVMSPTAAAMTVAAGGGGTNFTNGTHRCKATFANATGGDTAETGSTASAQFTTSSQSVQLSAIPLGPAGTSWRNVWCTQAGDLSEFKWTARVNDNTSTTATVGAADAALVLTIPKRNYSGAIPEWTVTNASAHASANGMGCGSTGSSIACYGIQTNLAGATSDTNLRASLDLSSLVSDWTLRAKVAWFGQTATSSNSIPTGNSTILGLRVGTASNAIMSSLHLNMGTTYGTGIVPAGMGRTTVGGARGGPTTWNGPWPAITDNPWWVQITRRASGVFRWWYTLTNQNSYSPNLTGTGVTSTTFGEVPSSPYDHFELELTSRSVTGEQCWIEVSDILVSNN